MLLVLASCDRKDRTPRLFELLSPEETGISFVNELPEDPGFNIVNYLNYYNGGGVAAGDVNADGLPDLYFTSNLGSDRLYLNRGNYRFEDATERAGVGGAAGWTSGVTMADVNGDGHLDIYVSSVHYLTMRGRNVLYVNDGDGTFTDRTREFGLEHVGFSTQATFFDFDGDGDLDMYLLNHGTHEERAASRGADRSVRHPRAGDRLFRNDGGRFADVSEEAGIYGGVEGYGLGVVVSDLNLDGCPDIFVANDFQEHDFLYYNDCDGTFTESIAVATGHTSRSSMGVDAADFDNDGRPDLVVVDMLPEREEILKSSATTEGYDLLEMRTRAGYHPQYARNTLQLNRGGGRFSEIGYLAGVHATDWSWAPLFADLDNDGHKDLFVTSGIYRRPNDHDYLAYVARPEMQAALRRGITRETLKLLLEAMPRVPIPNHAFRNNGDLTFTNMADRWGIAQPGFSNGAVYVDLNNSGALDLVVNNIGAPASIYRNRAAEVTRNRHLKVRLRGAGANTGGIGAKVIIRHEGRMQMLEQIPTRGFQSAVEPTLHFGIGRSPRVDSLTVVWPDRRYQVLTNVPVGGVVVMSQEEATGRYEQARSSATQPLFRDVTAALGLDFEHVENPFHDYGREPLIPHLLSTEGPALATGDVNGDGLDDLFVGGAKWQAARLYLQLDDGTFRAGSEEAFRPDSLSEDVDATFFDADGDGALDLFVVSGGNEFWGDHEALRDRLYLNDGKGRFRRATNALPDIFENGSCAVPGDFNGDGHLDLFVGSRVVSRAYGLSPRSHLLQNDGRGRFTDVTDRKAEGLGDVGMVTAAAWIDVDDDRQLDLVVVGEWMPVRVFRQRNGRFVDWTAESGFSGTEGWWNSVTVGDLNADGRQDLVLGNLGLNSYLRAAPDEPVRLYVQDFGRKGEQEKILTSYRNGVSYPLAGRDELARVLPALRTKYRTYADFGASRIEDVFPASDLRRATVREARLFSSSIALNGGGGRFELRPLPTKAQFAPVYASLVEDLDADGRVDILVAGNLHGVTPVIGRYDASYGLMLRGRGDGRFEPVDMEESNLKIDGQVRGLALLRGARGGRRIVVARNDDALVILEPLRRK